MSATYLVRMPRAEASYLAGLGPRGLAGPKDRALAAIREWVTGIAGRRTAMMPVATVVADLTAILDIVPAPAKPVCGPFAPPGNGRPPLPGTVAYLGGGTVRLDEDAIIALAALPYGDDFRVRYTNAGPLLSVGVDTYLVREEEPDAKR